MEVPAYSGNHTDRTVLIRPGEDAEDLDYQSGSGNGQHGATSSSSQPDHVSSRSHGKSLGSSTVEMKNPSQGDMPNHGSPPPSYGSLNCGNDDNRPNNQRQQGIIHPQPTIVTVVEPDTSACNLICLRKAGLILSIIALILIVAKFAVINAV